MQFLYKFDCSFQKNVDLQKSFLMQVFKKKNCLQIFLNFEKKSDLDIKNHKIY